MSQDRAAIHTSFLPGSGAAEMPPFWELEALIDQGFELDLALNVMAARRLQTPPPLSVASLAQTSEMRLDLTPAHQ